MPNRNRRSTRSGVLLTALLLLCAGCAGSEGTAAQDRDRAQPSRPTHDLPLEHIAFGSCLHQSRSTDILGRIADSDPDLFLFMGDNVYGDSSSPDQAELRAAYEDQFSDPNFSALLAAVPVLATWDDHDFGMNDGGAAHPYRSVAESIFDEFWQVDPESAAGARVGVHDAMVLGPEGRRVQIILLDTRSFRSELTATPDRGAPGRERYVPAADPERTLLGRQQWQWLAAQLREPAEIRLIVSSIQILADGHGWEAWRTLPLERERLFRTVRESGAEGVILLSGDRHRAGIYRREGVTDYPLHEITSSSLNLPIPNASEEAGPHRVGGTFLPVNYGDLRIDWERRRLRFSIRDAEGQSVHRLTISMDQLRRG